MKKTVIVIAAGVLVFLLFMMALLQYLLLAPLEWLTGGLLSLVESYHAYEGKQVALNYTGRAGINVVDGIQWLTPCNYTESTRRFGMDWHPIYHEWRMHYGVDMGAPKGTPIYATREGTVVSVGYNDSAGNYVVIQHDGGFRSTYMHMVQFIVSGGQEVKLGTVIGFVGSTGDSTGPHLHFQISLDGTPVDPEDYIDMDKKPEDVSLPDTTPGSKPVGEPIKEVS